MKEAAACPAASAGIAASKLRFAFIFVCRRPETAAEFQSSSSTFALRSLSCSIEAEKKMAGSEDGPRPRVTAQNAQHRPQPGQRLL